MTDGERIDLLEDLLAKSNERLRVMETQFDLLCEGLTDVFAAMAGEAVDDNG